MQRRQFITAVVGGLAAGLAGCASPDEEDSEQLDSEGNENSGDGHDHAQDDHSDADHSHDGAEDGEDSGGY